TCASRRIAAPRPAAVEGKPVALVDSMTQAGGMWGQGILDMAERAIRLARPATRFERVARPQIGVVSPELWAESMAARHGAVVTAAGAGAGCTACGVRAASAAEAGGLPAVLVCPAGVSAIAEATRRVTGLHEASIVSLPVSLFGLDREQIAAAVRPSAN